MAKDTQNDSGVSPLPLIDVSALRGTDERAFMRTAHAIGQAGREIGFFRIAAHGIAPELIAQTYAAAARFFAQPDAEKLRYYIGDSPNHRGYVPFSEKGDYPDEVHRSYEAFDLGLDLPPDDPDFLAGNRVLGPNVWPALAGFREAVATYYAQISGLGRLVTRALEAHLGLPPGTMTSQMTKPVSQLRLLHYVRGAQTHDHASVNMGAHTDYECLTLLHTRNPGLQVMMSDGDWIDVPVDPAVFVVNIGDMLEAWSNGVFRSTPHRVLNLSAERFSLPYFVAADYHTLIAPVSQLVTPERPAQYAPFIAGEHLERMLVRDFPYFRHRKLRAGEVSSQTGPVENPFENRMNTMQQVTCHS